MGIVLTTGAGGGGNGSDECNVTAKDVLKGKIYIGSDTDDEVGTGTLELTGSAKADQVLSGQTFYNTDAQNRQTGTMPNRGRYQDATSVNLWNDLDAGKIKLYFRVPGGYYGGFSTTLDPKAESEIAAEQSIVAQAVGVKGEKLLAGQNVLGVSGTATSDANATASQILSGYTAYAKGNKITGNVAVQSILSFSAAVYSSTAITFTWKNPAKGAYSGVIIVGKTGSYPTGINDGTRYYKGAGNNTAANGTSTATVSNFISGTTYYFRAFSYAIKDGAEWLHATSYTGTAATTKGQTVITSSGSWTVPAGVRSIDVFCVGGGSGGAAGESQTGGWAAPYYSGAGGGGGYTFTKKAIAVSPGQVIPVTIGAGGAGGDYRSRNSNPGGTTIFLNASTAQAAGGAYALGPSAGKGGSGGGTASASQGGSSYSSATRGGDGGSDGSNGSQSKPASSTPGTGQNTTTRAFGESSGTLYAGGGGAGGGAERTGSNDGDNYGMCYGGTGGSGGGGKGGGSLDGAPVAGTNGTGAGGGGGCRSYAGSISDYNMINGKNGGSGVIIVRWGY